MKPLKSDKRLKFERIFPATALTLLTATAVYALLRWICFTCGFEGIKEEAWSIYLPMLLTATVTYGILGRRIGIINDKGYSRGTPRNQISMIVLLTGTLMLGTAQGVVTYQYATTIRIESLGNGIDMPRSSYYDLADTSIELQAPGVHVDSRTISRRYGSYLEFHLYAVYPFEGQRNVWYGIHYTKDYRQRYASDEEVQRAYKNFIKSCVRKMDAIETGPSNLLQRVVSSNDRDGYIEAVRNTGSLGYEDNGKQIVILTKPKTYAEDRWIVNINVLIWSFPIGMALLALALMFVPIDRERIYRNRKLKAIRSRSSLITGFKLNEPENWPVTGIIAVIAGLFIIMTISGVDPLSPSGRELMKWGGASHARVFNGEWWLLASALFVHGGILHILGNLTTLIICLMFTPRLFGGFRTTLIFMLTGILSTLAAVLLPGSAVVGASGAIMGLYGAAIMATLSSKRRRKKTENGIWILIGVVALTLVFGMSIGISNTGHIAGLLSGAILGLIFVKKEPQRERRQTPIPEPNAAGGE